jgi:alpha-L-fucosidase
MIKMIRDIALKVIWVACMAIQVVFAQEQSVVNNDAAVEAYRVQDPEIILIAQKLLRTSDADVTELEVPNPHADAQWFPKAGLGLFMHWGIHSVVGAQPSWAMIKDYPHAGPVILYPPEKYFALAERFNPTNWNPEKWLGTAKAAGFTYAVLTTKHHDGYALWPSRFGNFSTRQYLDRRDLLKSYVAACRKHGLKVGFYFSPRDWHYPNFPVSDVDFDYNRRFNFRPVDPQINRKHFEQFFTYTIGQLHELLTQYGKIDVLWFDGMGWHGIDDMHTKAVYKWIRSLQPGIVINERWSKVRNPDAANELQGFGDFTTVECRQADKRPIGWWETCDIWDTGGGWGYDKNERIKNLEWTLKNLIFCKSWGGNFLPNVGPRPDGEMTSGFYSRCKELEEWMTKHHNSVFGTTAHPHDHIATVPLTCRPGEWYLHISPMLIRKEKIIVKTTQPVRNVYIMRTGAEVQYDIKGGTYQLDPPSGSLREVIVMELAAESNEQSPADNNLKAVPKE